MNPSRSNPFRPITRRTFLESTAAAAAAITAGPVVGADTSPATAETIVGQLYGTLSDQQRQAICFNWDHVDQKRGLLRSFVANNWNITEHEIISDFYSGEQQELIRKVFESIIHPDWHDRYDKQLEDDAGGFGHEQSIAIFGQPGEGKFELVMTGRHMTLRCDGNSADHVALGGPVFYGHAPEFDESPTHPDNVFWHQAVAANKLYQMLDGSQQEQARVAKTPREQSVAFRGSRGDMNGLAVTEMSSDQQEHLQKVLGTLTEMYRTSDQEEIMQCLRKQGGLDACHLSFYTDHDLGDDQIWDNWRLEGPSFVWHYRGAPHVHVWVNVADSPDVPLNA